MQRGCYFRSTEYGSQCLLEADPSLERKLLKPVPQPRLISSGRSIAEFGSSRRITDLPTLPAKMVHELRDDPGDLHA
jgi:hypothetical protein